VCSTGFGFLILASWLDGCTGPEPLSEGEVFSSGIQRFPNSTQKLGFDPFVVESCGSECILRNTSYGTLPTGFKKLGSREFKDDLLWVFANKSPGR
jgi:hypothetical protein